MPCAAPRAAQPWKMPLVLGTMAFIWTVVSAAATADAAATTATTGTQANIPAGGGLAALDVRVDLASGAVDENGLVLPIPIPHDQLPAESDVVVEDVAIGHGRHVAHVRVPVRDPGKAEGGSAWEAVLAAGRSEPIFAGMTGLASGDPGERVGKAIEIVPDGSTSFLLVGDVKEDLTLCGEPTTLLDPLALYPESLELRPATVQRVSAERQAGAENVVAVVANAGTASVPSAAPEAPLAQLLVARGSSVPDSRGAELTDGNPKTVWQEERPGIGQGEFVVMASPQKVPITRMEIALSPEGAGPGHRSAAPKTLFLLTSTRTIEVTLPPDPGGSPPRPGARYVVSFARPIEASCVAVVLNAAFDRGLPHPDVGIAELTAYSEFDRAGSTLDDVAKELSGDRGDAAAEILERAGSGSVAAVTAAYENLDARGRARAMDVAASREPCESAAALLARGLCEKAGQAPRKAREKIERCKGAAPALEQQLRDDEATRACVAPVLATIAPEAALAPIADAIAATKIADAATRAVLRAAFAQALSEQPRDKLAPLLADTRRSPAGRLEMMRAAHERVADAPAESEATVTELLTGAPETRVRYLVLDPLSILAHAGDALAVRHIADAAEHDAAWPVRARAAELAKGLAGAQGALLIDARDPEPRVREAALGSLAQAPSAEAVRVAVDALDHDGWSFVKVRAIGVLVSAPASQNVDDALGRSLADPAGRVRGAALVALARRRAVSWRDAIRERLDDRDEDAEVRGAAASALGAVCDGKSLDRLTELARTLGTPGSDEDAQQVGFGALVGLAALKPPDLRDRLAPLLAPSETPYVRAAATRALAARGMCR